MRKGVIAWPGKYPAPDDVEKEKKRVGNESAWQREYLLHIDFRCGTSGHPEWIHYYEYR